MACRCLTDKENGRPSKSWIFPVIVTLCSFFSSIWCMLMYAEGNCRYPFYILALVYCICFFLARGNAESATKAPGALAINILAFVRYSIAPLIFCTTDELSRFCQNYQYVNEAIALMVYEMMAVFIVLELTSCKLRLPNGRIDRQHGFYEMPGGFLVAILIIAAMCLIAAKYKNFAGGIQVLLTGDSVSSNSNENNVINIVWQVLCVWLYTYYVMAQKRKFISGNERNIFPKVYIATFILILISFIESTGLSRWYTIVTAGASVALLIHQFPFFKRRIITFVVIPAICLVLLITLYKNGGYGGSSNSDISESLLSLFSSSWFDAYFAGPMNVNSGIGMKETMDFGPGSIFIDLFNSMPIVNHFINQTMATANGFNLYIGRLWNGVTGDQIIPLVSQSSIYFGYIGAPLLSIGCVLLSRFFDGKFQSDYSYTCYMYAFSGIFFAVIPMMLNFTVLSTWMFIKIIPFFIALLVSNHAAKRVSEKTENQIISIKKACIQ